MEQIYPNNATSKDEIFIDENGDYEDLKREQDNPNEDDCFGDWYHDNHDDLVEAFIEENEDLYATFLEKEYKEFREEMKYKYKEPMDWR